MTITVYSKPGCPACDATCRALNRYGLPFEVVDLSTDAAALDRVKDLGHQQAPVVVVDSGHGQVRHWSGFRLDLIRGLTAAHQHTPSTKEAA